MIGDTAIHVVLVEVLIQEAEASVTALLIGTGVEGSSLLYLSAIPNYNFLLLLDISFFEFVAQCFSKDWTFSSFFI